MSSKTEVNNSKSPQAGALLPRLQERTVSVENPITGKYDSHFIHQKVTIALYHNHALLSLVQVNDQTPLCLDATQTERLQAAIQDVTELAPSYPAVPHANKTEQVIITLFADPHTKGETGCLVRVKPTADELGVLMAARDALDAHIDLAQRRCEIGR